MHKKISHSLVALPQVLHKINFFKDFFQQSETSVALQSPDSACFYTQNIKKLKQNHCKLKPKIFKSILFSLNDYLKTSKWRNIVCCLKDDFYECNLTHFACYNFHMAITFY